jgi:ferredoxin
MVKKIKIDKEKCVGCGLCMSINSDNFEMTDNVARVKKNVEKIDKIKEAIVSCPNGAITFS